MRLNELCNPVRKLGTSCHELWSTEYGRLVLLEWRHLLGHAHGAVWAILKCQILVDQRTHFPHDS